MPNESGEDSRLSAQKGVREHFPRAASSLGAIQTEVFSDPFFATHNVKEEQLLPLLSWTRFIRMRMNE